MTATVHATIGAIANWNKSPEAKVNDLFEANRGNYCKIESWIRDMPKGGNLHIHLLGALNKNDLIQWAKEANLYFNPATMNFSRGPGENLVHANTLETNKEYYQKFCNMVSMNGAVAYRQTPCNHFMYTCFGPIYSIAQNINAAKLLDKVRKQEALAKASYVEMYVGLAQLRDLADQMDKLDLDSMPKTRFICEASRIEPGFENTVSAFAGLQKRFPKYIKSLTIVGPEYDPNAAINFKNQIRILSNIWADKTNACPLAIHGGELTLDVASPETLSTRISETLKIPNLKRLGHGTCIIKDADRDTAVETLKANDIAVEICLESNKQILNVKGEKHPLRFFLEKKVKVVFGSDDPAVLGTDLSDQFITAFFDHNLSYLELKKIAFNSITFSFLPGNSIFKDNGEIKPEFIPAMQTGWSPHGAVKATMEASEKAKMELDLLQQFAVFEQRLVG